MSRVSADPTPLVNAGAGTKGPLKSQAALARNVSFRPVNKKVVPPLLAAMEMLVGPVDVDRVANPMESTVTVVPGRGVNVTL